MIGTISTNTLIKTNDQRHSINTECTDFFFFSYFIR
jgi:hypothetical protein